VHALKGPTITLVDDGMLFWPSNGPLGAQVFLALRLPISLGQRSGGLLLGFCHVTVRRECCCQRSGGKRQDSEARDETVKRETRRLSRGRDGEVRDETVK
jgi:hypothetical protein